MNAKLQKAEEVCESCRKFWEAQHLPPKRLVHVFYADGTEVTTENQGIEIVICPHCDGDVILKLDKEH